MEIMAELQEDARVLALGPTSISALVTRLRSPPETPRTMALPTMVSAAFDRPSVRSRISIRTPVPHTYTQTLIKPRSKLSADSQAQPDHLHRLAFYCGIWAGLQKAPAIMRER